jgi:hypothetical protein
MSFRVAVLSIALVAPLGAQTAVKEQAPAKEQPAAELPSARSIIDRHVKAIGGREAVLSHKSQHGIGTFAVAASGMNGTFEMFGATNPDRILLKVSMPGVGDIANGFDGTHGWSINPMTGPMLQQGKELEQAKLDADFYNELRDPKKYPTIKTVGKLDFEGRPCYKVSLTRTDGVEDFDFYDAATGLRAGSINTRETPMGTMTTTVVESDYKKFANVLQATTVVQRTMGIEQKITLQSLDYDKVDASVFEPPAEIKALIK